LPTTPALLATLDSNTAALCASALSAAYPNHPDGWPTDPLNLYWTARRAHLDTTDVVRALEPFRATATGAVLGLMEARLPPAPPAPSRVVLPSGEVVTLCPPRTYALDCNDQPRTPITPPLPTRSRTARRDPRVVLSVAPNPKKPGSACHARYAHYQVGRSIDECIAAGVTRADVRWDTAQGFITVSLP
jgi:hypothetical protein